MSIQTKAELALLGITFIWGTSFTIVKDAIARIDALEFLALRFLVATLVLVVLFRGDLRKSQKSDLVAAVWIGLLLWVGFTLQVKGLELTTPSKSAFVTGFSVILVPLFEGVLKRKIPSAVNLLCAACALVGLYLLTGTRSLRPIDWGIFLTFLCAVGFAIHVIVVGHYARARNLKVLVVGQIGVTAVASSVLSMRNGIPPLHLSGRIVAAILVTAILATALAFYTQNWAQKHTLPSRTALIFSMEPVFAAVVTYYALHERWNAQMAAGCGLIFIGIIASEIRSKEKISIEPMA
ncbi:MAG: DMT family transporter [Acidobacteriia bacterium]|nr:DMT family transporter [Terriglobia bacterium]